MEDVEKEVGFWDSGFGTFLKWTLIGAAVLATAGAALFFIKPFQEWVDDKFGNEYGKKAAYLFESNIYKPLSGVGKSSVVNEQDIVEKVKIGDVIIPDAKEDFLESETFQKPDRLQKLSNLKAELRKAGKAPSDFSIFKTKKQTTGQMKSDLTDLQEEAEKFAYATEKWDELAVLYNNSDQKLQKANGGELLIPVIDINEKIKNKLGDKPFSSELEDYAITKYGLDAWNDKTISRRVFDLSKQLDNELERSYKDLVESSGKPNTNYTGFEGGKELHRWYDISGAYDWKDTSSALHYINPVTKIMQNSWNLEESIRDGIISDIKTEKYPAASEKIQKAINFFNDRANKSGDDADKIAAQYFETFQEYMSKASLKAELMPTLEKTYGVVADSILPAKGAFQDYHNEVALLQEKQGIEDGKKRVDTVKKTNTQAAEKSDDKLTSGVENVAGKERQVSGASK